MGLLDKFLPDQYYHVFSRTNNKEKLFYSDENRRYFLNKVQLYLKPYFEIHAYALLGNHYHLLLRVKSSIEIIRSIKGFEIKDRTKAMIKLLEIEEENTRQVLKTCLVFSSSIDRFLIHQIQRLSISYTKSLNKQINRTGHLFNRPFKRSMINFDTRYHYLVYYIHHNARKHGFVKNFLEYTYHSFMEIIAENSILIDYKSVFEAFGGKENFLQFHFEKHLENEFQELAIEE